VEALRPGDPIDVVAPSSGFDRERFERGVQALRGIGLQPRFREEIFSRTGHLAGDDARRKRELDEAFRSDAKALILARGGYGLLRFATELRKFPRKLVIGYSGATGFVIGDLFAPGEDPAGREEVVAERLASLAVPVVFGAPFGHAGRNQPVAFGCAHALDAGAGQLTPLESPIAAAQS